MNRRRRSKAQRRRRPHDNRRSAKGARRLADEVGFADPVGRTNRKVNWKRFKGDWKPFRTTPYAVSVDGGVMNAKTGHVLKTKGRTHITLRINTNVSKRFSIAKLVEEVHRKDK